MNVKNQISRAEARKLFDYRGGVLFWRHAGSGRRRDLRAATVSGNRAEINIGGVRYQAHYIIWNWHNGVTRSMVRFRDGNRMNAEIDNLIEVDSFISAPSPHVAECPCCKQPVATPTLEVIVASCGVSELEARILGAVWAGKGQPVFAERIFDAMYADDRDGGPSPEKMYDALKFGLHRLRGRLEGSGVSIENVGYRRGYRLLLKENT